MRYVDFKIVETRPTDANDPRGPDHRNDPTAVVAQELAAGPPYPQEDTEAVRQLQSNLEEIGYTVGSTGVDGKYGPRTTAAVRAFKKDYNVDGAGLSIDAAGLETLSKVVDGSIQRVEEPTPTGNEGGSVGDLGDLASLENIGQAKEVVEDFLGSTVDDEELNMLIRATAAEASPNSQERGAVAAVILNRVRSNRYPNSIEAVLTQRNQFQAVTGTRYDPGPHSNFSNMSDRTGAQVIGALIRYLPNTDKSWLNFTANSAAAYGPGTNIDFMRTMRQAQGSQVIGGTVFGTA
jgi:peptidoglycan hydrolase-like protein with peptidoglycan-binding domain